MAPQWLHQVLEEKCASQCLDTPEERAVVAAQIYKVMREIADPPVSARQGADVALGRLMGWDR